MRTAAAVALSRSERENLEEWTGSLPSSGRVAGRARIVLEAADGRTNSEIADRVGVHPGTVARWRSRFLANGIDGLRREGPRSGHANKVPKEMIERILERTVREDDPNGTPWTTRSLARSLHTNHMLVHRVWTAYRLTSNPRRPAPVSPADVAWVELAGVYAGPPAAALVFAVDSRPAPALGRERLPTIVPNVTGRPEFASPLEATGDLLTALRRFEERRPSERPSRSSTVPFLVFLRSVQAQAPPSARLDIILDRPISDVDQRVRDWLSAHDRFRTFTTNSGDSWVRAVDSWLSRWERARVHPESLRGLPGSIALLSPDDRSGSRAPLRRTWTNPQIEPAGRSLSSSKVHGSARATGAPPSGRPRQVGRQARYFREPAERTKK